MRDLARKTVDGATLNVSTILFKTILQFAVVLPILARTISPEQFGLVGMAMAFVTFFTMFNDLGISAALVRADKPSDAFWSTAFWTNLGLGAVLTLLTYSAAPWIADFFREPMVQPLVEALSLILFMHCLFLVPMAWLQRNFRFGTIAAIDMTATIVSAAGAIWAAFEGYGVWALVLQQLLLFSIKMIGGLIAQRAPLKLTYRWSEIVAVLPFSLGLTGTAMVTFVNRNSDNILIGRFLGAESLGFYGRAYQVMLVPVHALSLGAGFALYPAMSAIKSDLKRLGVLYTRAISILACACVPLMVGLALVAEPFVALVFGPKWATVAPVLVWLSLVGILQAFISTSSELWKALGHADVLFRWSLIRMVGFVTAFSIGIWQGSIAALALAYLIANLVLFIPFLAVTLRRIEVDVARFLAALAPSLVSSAMMATVLVALPMLLPSLTEWPSFVQLSVLVPVGVISYGLCMIVGFKRFVVDLLKEAKALFASPSANGAHAE